MGGRREMKAPRALFSCEVRNRNALLLALRVSFHFSSCLTLSRSSHLSLITASPLLKSLLPVRLSF